MICKQNEGGSDNDTSIVSSDTFSVDGDKVYIESKDLGNQLFYIIT